LEHTPQSITYRLGNGAEAQVQGKRAQNETPGHVLGARNGGNTIRMVCRARYICKRTFVSHDDYSGRGVSYLRLPRTGRWDEGLCPFGPQGQCRRSKSPEGGPSRRSGRMWEHGDVDGAAMNTQRPSVAAAASGAPTACPTKVRTLQLSQLD